MTETQGPPLLQSRLSAAQVKVEAGDYRGAIQVIREAKAMEPKNIYVLAFEKQVEQLVEMSDLKLLTDDQRSDILESLPGIIERALEGSATPSGSPPPTDTRAELNREREERNAALEWLKNQYFQHAHDYVRKGEYQYALAEIRRVYIIDPNNRIAKEFEQQIDQLIALRREQTNVHHGTAATAEAKGKLATSASAAPGAADAAGSPGPEKKPPNWTLIIAIVLTLVAAGIASYYFLKREKINRPPGPTERSLSEMVDAQAPSVGEQIFTIAQTEGGGTVRTSAVPDAAPAALLPTNQPDLFLPGRGGGGSSPGGGTNAPPPAANSSGTGDPLRDLQSLPSSSTPSPIDNREDLIEDARIVRLERPQLPEGIYASGLEGQVVVRVEIDADGNPLRVGILRSTNNLLDRVVIDAVNRSQFSPRRLHSGPVGSAITIPFTFRARR